MYKELSKQLEEKLKKHHELYRLPCRAEQWEDIFDQCINPKYSSWVGSGHDVGADVISENGILFEQNMRIQNKSGQIDFKKGTLKWNGHRTTKHKTLDDSWYYEILNKYNEDLNLSKRIVKNLVSSNYCSNPEFISITQPGNNKLLENTKEYSEI